MEHEKIFDEITAQLRHSGRDFGVVYDVERAQRHGHKFRCYRVLLGLPEVGLEPTLPCDARHSSSREDALMHDSGDSRNEQTCRRCFCREYIPTDRLVKFDNQVNYLCQKCWEDYRRWFHWGSRPTPSRPPIEI